MPQRDLYCKPFIFAFAENSTRAHLSWTQAYFMASTFSTPTYKQCKKIVHFQHFWNVQRRKISRNLPHKKTCFKIEFRWFQRQKGLDHWLLFSIGFRVKCTQAKFVNPRCTWSAFAWPRSKVHYYIWWCSSPYFSKLLSQHETATHSYQGRVLPIALGFMQTLVCLLHTTYSVIRWSSYSAFLKLRHEKRHL